MYNKIPIDVLQENEYIYIDGVVCSGNDKVFAVVANEIYYGEKYKQKTRIVVYTRINDKHVLTDIIELSDSQAELTSVRSISINHEGNIIVVGSCRSKKIYVLALVNNKWIEREVIIATETISKYVPDSMFAESIVLSPDGKTMLVNDYNVSTDEQFRMGKVYLYKYIEDTWSLVHVFLPELKSAFLTFGGAIAMSDDGKTIAISQNTFSPKVNEKDIDFSGGVVIYKLIDDTWTKLTELWNEERHKGSVFFGQSLSLSADGKVLAASTCNNGRAYKRNWITIFREVDNKYIKEKRLCPRFGSSSNNFGILINLSKDGTVLTVDTDDVKKYDKTKTIIKDILYVFKYTDGVWSNHLIVDSDNIPFEERYRCYTSSVVSSDNKTVYATYTNRQHRGQDVISEIFAIPIK